MAVAWTRAEPPCPEVLLTSAGQMLSEIVRRPELHEQGLVLAFQVVRRTKDPSLLCTARN